MLRREPAQTAEAPEPAVPGAQEGLPWLVCEACGLPLLSEAELIEEKFECWNKVTWAYELSVLGRESVWCYSATNAHDHRFDVVRVLPSACDRSISCRGEPTPEYSWFPGFSWSMAHCKNCGRHLGWGFTPDEPCASAGEASSCSASRSRKRAAQAGPAELHMEVTNADAATDDATSGPRSGSVGAEGVAVGTVPQQEGVAMGTVQQQDAQREQPAVEEREQEDEEVEAEGGDAADATQDSDDSEVDGPPGPGQGRLSFFGLVLTKMREKDLSGEEVDRRFQAMEESRRAQALVQPSPRQFLRSLLRMMGRARSGEQVDPGLLLAGLRADADLLAEGGGAAAVVDAAALFEGFQADPDAPSDLAEGAGATAAADAAAETPPAGSGDGQGRDRPSSESPDGTGDARGT